MLELVDDGGGMSEDDFIRVVKERKLGLTDEQAMRMFEMYDANKNGSIDKDEAEQLIQQLRYHVTATTLRADTQ